VRWLIKPIAPTAIAKLMTNITPYQPISLRSRVIYSNLRSAGCCLEKRLPRHRWRSAPRPRRSDRCTLGSSEQVHNRMEINPVRDFMSSKKGRFVPTAFAGVKLSRLHLGSDSLCWECWWPRRYLRFRSARKSFPIPGQRRGPRRKPEVARDPR